MLNIGCGTGMNAIWLAQRGFETVGMDIAPTAIERAREKAGRAGVANVRFVCGDILETLPVARCSVDLVLDRGYFPVVTLSPLLTTIPDMVLVQLRVTLASDAPGSKSEIHRPWAWKTKKRRRESWPCGIDRKDQLFSMRRGQ